MVVVVGAPPIRGIGRTGGFKFVVEDRGDLGLRRLQQQTANLVDKGNQLPGANGRPQLIKLVERVPRQCRRST